jgi:hypothetical protein
MDPGLTLAVFGNELLDLAPFVGDRVVEGSLNASRDQQFAIVVAAPEGVVELLEVDGSAEEAHVGSVVGDDLGGVAHAGQGEGS